MLIFRNSPGADEMKARSTRGSQHSPLRTHARLSASCSGRSSGGCEGREAAALSIPAIQTRPLQAPRQ